MGSIPNGHAAHNQSPSLTRLAARHLLSPDFHDLPSEVKQKASLCLLDYLGATISGLSSPWSSSLLRYAETRPGAPEAHLWGSANPVSAEVAAFTNAALGHSNIRDDMHVAACSHIGTIVIPGALALAQRDGWSGEQLVKAIVRGYEMAARLGIALRQGGKVNPHFRPSGIIGAFGVASAAIAGAAKKIDEDTAVQVLGFAANMAAGFNEWPWAGGMEIYTHMGTASRGGIMALDLATAGMQSSESILEGKDGLFEAYGAGAEGARAFGEGFTSLDGLAAGIMSEHFKPVAGCNYIQTPVSLALQLAKDVRGKTSEIEKIVITVTSAAKAYPGCDSTGPLDNLQQTKMSIQYGVSSALLYGRVDEESFVQYNDRDLLDLVSKCEVNTADHYDMLYAKGKQPAEVFVDLGGKGEYRKETEDVPWLTGGEAVKGRFRHEASSVLGKDAVEEVVQLAEGLWQLKDCSSLFKAFATQAKRN